MRKEVIVTVPYFTYHKAMCEDNWQSADDYVRKKWGATYTVLRFMFKDGQAYAVCEVEENNA